MIHARCQAQRRIAAVAVSFDQIAVMQQVGERVRKTFGLVECRPRNRPTGADNGVAWTHQNFRRPVDRTRAVLQFASEAIVHAAKMRLLRFAQVEVRENPPRADREIAHQRLLDLAEPSYELCRQTARNPIREQEIDVLLLEHTENLGTHRHGSVTSCR